MAWLGGTPGGRVGWSPGTCKGDGAGGRRAFRMRVLLHGAGWWSKGHAALGYGMAGRALD